MHITIPSGAIVVAERRFESTVPPHFSLWLSVHIIPPKSCTAQLVFPSIAILVLILESVFC